MTLNVMANFKAVEPPPPVGSAEERAEVASVVGFYAFDVTCHRLEELLRSSLLWEA